MNKDLEEKIIMLLRTLAYISNWEIHEIRDENGKWIENELVWNKRHYNPSLVAQELLDDLISE